MKNYNFILYFIFLIILFGCSKSQSPVPSPESKVEVTTVLPKPQSRQRIMSTINEEKILNNISKGSINYVVQDTMIVNKISEVNMTISQGVDKERIISEIKTFNKLNLHTDSIRVSPVMRARLVDASGGINFRVVSKTNEEQFLEEGDYTRWTWDVTPLIKGNNNLSIVVDIIFNNKSKSIQVYDGVIYVYSDESFLIKMWNFIIEHWEFIISGLLVPTLLVILTEFKKKKKKN